MPNETRPRREPSSPLRSRKAPLAADALPPVGDEAQSDAPRPGSASTSADTPAPYRDDREREPGPTLRDRISRDREAGPTLRDRMNRDRQAAPAAGRPPRPARPPPSGTGPIPSPTAPTPPRSRSSRPRRPRPSSIPKTSSTSRTTMSSVT